MNKILFYNKFIIYLQMFRALCAHHQVVKLYYTASGIVTPVGGRPVRKLREGGQHNIKTAISYLDSFN